jgi:hypothetical protein
MNVRSVAALLLTPTVGGVLPAISYIATSSVAQLGLQQAIQIGAWVVFTLLFEGIVLVPLALLFRGSAHFRVAVFLIGTPLWLTLSLAWLWVVFELSPGNATTFLLPLGMSAAAACTTFACLWPRANNV